MFFAESCYMFVWIFKFLVICVAGMLDVSMLGLCSVRRKEEFVFGFETIFYIELNVVKFCWYDVFISKMCTGIWERKSREEKESYEGTSCFCN